MGYSYAYNGGSSPSGTTKFAKLQIGGNNREYTNYGSLNWYASAPYDGKFLIVSDTYSQGWSTEVNSTPTFWRSTENTLDSLKDLVNQLPDVNGVTGFTTATDAINYINSTDKYLISQESDVYAEGEVVTSGLTLHLDTGYSNSYPKSGTTWYDVCPIKNNGSLVNGTFYSGDTMNFDGTNDYVSFPSNFNATTAGLNGYHTVEMWVYPTNLGFNDGLFRCNNGGGAGRYLHYIIRGATFNLGWYFIDTQTNSGTVSLNTWYQVVFMFDTDDRQKVYINGVLSKNGSVLSGNPNLVDGKFFNGGTAPIQIGYYAAHFKGKMPIVRVYNRALSASEVLQNYNAQKGRFGL